MLTRLKLAARGLFQRDLVERELDDELRFHLEQQTNMLIARGMSPAAARRAAIVALGGIEPTREAQRQGRGSRGIEDLFGDIRHAGRALWHDKPLAVAGLLTLALGVGATTAVFSAVNAVMLRELPFADSRRVVALWEENKPRGWYKKVAAPANYLDWAQRAKTFTGIAAYTDYATTVTLLGQGDPRLLTASYVTGNFVDVLGVRPALGRGFDAADTWDDGQRPAMISFPLWKSQFGGDSSVIGREMSFGGRRGWRIIGVMPEGFAFPMPTTDVWLPVLFSREDRTAVSFRRAHWLRVIGRMKDGVTPVRANADLQAVVQQLKREYPATNAQMGAGLTPIREWIVGDTRQPLLILLGASIILLVIACANVGNLLLVHAVSRTREMSLRFVLGASRLRVARLALAQSLLLSLAGGVAGLIVGWIGARALLAMQPGGMLPVTDIPLDHRVWLFALGMTTMSGIAFGLSPALLATRQSPAAALSAGGRAIAGGGVRRWARQLVIAEVALASVLLVGAGLLVRSYRNVAALPAGFDAEGVLTVSLGVPSSRYDSATKVLSFYHQLLGRISAQSGVASAAAVRQLPVTDLSWSSSLAVQGRPPIPEGQDVLHREVLGNYFGVMHVPVRKGRIFGPGDVLGGPSVVVINEALANRFFPNEDPIGKVIAFDRVADSTSHWHTIIGVVGDERQASIVEAPRPEVFAAFDQDWTRGMNLVVRAKPGIDPMSLAGGVRSAIRGLDSLLAINELRPMTEVHRAAMARQRFLSVLVFVFASTGVALAIVGVFGVLAQLVQSRTREMGLRIALGAMPAQVRWLVVGNGLGLVSAGVVAGLLIAVGATRVMSSLLYGVTPGDMTSYVAAGLVLLILGAVAAAIPAARASGADPASTLRAD